jgi:U3 small nucleolar RNA-associated protein 7
MGLSSILVPRSGEPNFDTFVDNPMETTTQKWEEVHALLEKLPPDTIMLNPILIATVRAAKKKKKTKKEIEEEMEEAVDTTKNMERKKKTKGRSKPSKRAKKKEEDVFRDKRSFPEESKEVHGLPDKKQHG